MSMAFFLPVVGIFWGHDLFRGIPGYPSMMVVIGLALAWQRVESPGSLPAVLGREDAGRFAASREIQV
jgi:hypothetical protein